MKRISLTICTIFTLLVEVYSSSSYAYGDEVTLECLDDHRSGDSTELVVDVDRRVMRFGQAIEMNIDKIEGSAIFAHQHPVDHRSPVVIYALDRVSGKLHSKRFVQICSEGEDCELMLASREHTCMRKTALF